MAVGSISRSVAEGESIWTESLGTVGSWQFVWSYAVTPICYTNKAETVDNLGGWVGGEVFATYNSRATLVSKS